MKKSESNQIAKRQVEEWLDRNRDPGVLASIPVIMISSLTGDKPGITLNLNGKMPLTDVVTILKAATTQVEQTIKKLEDNGGNAVTQ